MAIVLATFSRHRRDNFLRAKGCARGDSGAASFLLETRTRNFARLNFCLWLVTRFAARSVFRLCLRFLSLTAFSWQFDEALSASFQDNLRQKLAGSVKNFIRWSAWYIFRNHRENINYFLVSSLLLRRRIKTCGKLNVQLSNSRRLFKYRVLYSSNEFSKGQIYTTLVIKGSTWSCSSLEGFASTEFYYSLTM